MAHHIRIAGPAVGLVLAALAAGAARAEICAREAFETAVGEAAVLLRDLNMRNRPVFQARLRELKEKRGWSHDEFLKAAAPLVQDERIQALDERSAEFLARIEAMGAEGSGGNDASCAALAEVRRHMRALVEVQTEKWSYMFGKVEQELRR